MPRRDYDDFRIGKRDGQWVVWIRSSPEDMDEYDLKKGVRKILGIVEEWQASAEYHIEEAQRAEELSN